MFYTFANYLYQITLTNLKTKKMKKLFFLLTIVGLMAFASCKSSESKSDATADTTAQVDSTVTVDTTVAQ